MPLDPSSEKVFRDFEVNTLDVHHQQLPLWQRPVPHALFSILAQFDCNAILFLFMPGSMPGIGPVQVFKSTEEALSQAVKWFHDGRSAIDVLPHVDRGVVSEAGSFCQFAGTYVDIADFHKMYGQGQVIVSVDEATRTVRFTSAQGVQGRSPLSGMAESAHRISELPVLKDPAALEHIRRPAFDALAATPFHIEDGRIVLDDLTVASNPAIVRMLDTVFPKEPVLLPPDSDLAGFSLGEFTSFFEALRRWSLCATFTFVSEVISGRRQQWECVPTQVVPLDQFRESMAMLSGLQVEKVDQIVRTLTFDRRTKSPDIYQQPLLVGPTLVAWSAMLVVNSRYIRNILKLLSRTPAMTDHAATLIGSQEPAMLREIGQLLSTKGGMQFKLATEIAIGGERAEIDLLAYNTRFPEEVLVVEGKAVLGVDEITEVASATKEMQKGQGQLARSIAMLESLSVEERQKVFKFVRWPSVTSTP